LPLFKDDVAIGIKAQAVTPLDVVQFMTYPTEQFQIIPTVALGGVGSYVAGSNRFDMVNDLTERPTILTEPKLGRKKSVAAFLPLLRRIERSKYSGAHGIPAPFRAKKNDSPPSNRKVALFIL